MGLLDFFGFGKKRKTDLGPPPEGRRSPAQTELFFTKPLRELGTESIAGLRSPLDSAALDRFGLGADLANKLTSPVAAQSKLRFQTETAPGISSAASARGLGRSSIPVRQIAQADVERGAGLDVLLSQLELLNRQAARGQQQFGTNIAGGLQTQQARLKEARAREEERGMMRTTGVAEQRNAEDLARQNQFLQATGGALGVPISGGQPQTQFGGGPGGGFASATTPGATQIGNIPTNVARSNIQGADTSSDTQSLLQAIIRMLGGQ